MGNDRSSMSLGLRRRKGRTPSSSAGSPTPSQSAKETLDRVEGALSSLERYRQLEQLYGHVESADLAQLKARILEKIRDTQHDGDQVVAVCMGIGDFNILRQAIPERAGQTDDWKAFGYPVKLVDDFDGIEIAILPPAFVYLEDSTAPLGTVSSFNFKVGDNYTVDNNYQWPYRSINDVRTIEALEK